MRSVFGLALAGVVLSLGGCASFLHRISTTVAPVPNSDPGQLRLSCHDSASGRCYFRYVDVATGTQTEHVVPVGQDLLVPDIAGPARLCVSTSSVTGRCWAIEQDVGPRGLYSLTIKG